MDGNDSQAPAAPSVEELQREIRGLKRKLALTEANLTRSRLISVAQERIDSILDASLNKELQFFKLVLDNAINILLLFDFDGRFAYASNTFLVKAGIGSFGLISGRHYQEVLASIFSAESLESFTCAVEQAVGEKRTVTLETRIVFEQEEKPCTFSILVTPMTDEQGESTGIMALFNDITEINDALGAANRASLAKSEFLANMSHEIRTPLNAIIGMSAIAQCSEDLEKIHYCIDKINDSSKYLLGVLNDILDMSKIETNHFELSFSDFVFEKILLRIIDVMRFKFEEKKIALRLYCDPKIPYVIVSDEQRLAQVIMNLLSNAVKFTPERGRVSVSAEVESMTEEDCVLRFSVKDSGIGISEEQKPRLFKAFSQADNSISRKFGGTGLGLVISKNIVQMLGGDITFDSIPGKETTFSFNIKAKARKYQPEIGSRFQDIRLLVVDPDVDAQAAFFASANRLGLACSAAQTSADALSLLEKQPHQIVFVDRKVSANLSFIRKLTGSDDKIMVVMMMPASDWSEIEKVAKKAGTRGFISKPILLPTIESVLSKYNQEKTQKKRKSFDSFAEKNILLVDDIQINREIIITLLEHTGINITSAENGREAVELYTANPTLYDLIIMDIQMPEMDGYEATRLIRKAEGDKARRIPIVAMTANVFREDVERCLSCGMDDHIGKPVNVDEVLQRIRRWMA